MHYFNNAGILQKKISEGTKKIRVEFAENFSYDSIRYSLQKFIYSNNKWIKISDMGFLKGETDLNQQKNIITEFGRQIIVNTIEYSYN